jgi:hypothetical protein
MSNPKHQGPASEWDDLAAELGLEPAQHAAPPARKQPPPEEEPVRAAQPPHPEPEDEADDFPRISGGLTSDVAPAVVIEDPASGYAVVVSIDEHLPSGSDEDDEILEAPDEVAFDEGGGDEGTEPAAEGTQERTGRRRRRRRRKKSRDESGLVAEGAPSEVGAGGELDEAAEDIGDEDETPGLDEAAEAPGPVEVAEDKPAVPAAIEEELDAEAAEPQPQWNVVSWTDLVATLYRPER